MKTKEEVIKEAWGKNYPPSGTDKNGWSNDLVNYGTFDTKIFDYIGFKNDAKIRPKSLEGIENNNFWIKLNGIANEIDYDGDIFIYTKQGNIELLTQNDFLPINYATHYQPIVKPKKPLY